MGKKNTSDCTINADEDLKNIFGGVLLDKKKEAFCKYQSNSESSKNLYKKFTKFSRIIFVKHPNGIDKKHFTYVEEIYNAICALACSGDCNKCNNDSYWNKFYGVLQCKNIALIDLVPAEMSDENSNKLFNNTDWPSAVKYALKRFLERLNESNDALIRGGKNPVELDVFHNIQCAFLTEQEITSPILKHFENEPIVFGVDENERLIWVNQLFDNSFKLNKYEVKSIFNDKNLNPQYTSDCLRENNAEYTSYLLKHALGLDLDDGLSLEHHRSVFRKLIASAFNGLKNNIHSPIAWLNIRLLIRWYPQINQFGEDSYSLFYACKNSKKYDLYEDKFKQLKKCINIKYSILAKDTLESGPIKFTKKVKQPQTNTTIDKDIVEVPIHFEHNPPVNVMFKKLLQITIEKCYELTEQDVGNCFELNFYDVIIISKDQQVILDSKYRETGEWWQRCCVMEGNENPQKNEWVDTKYKNSFPFLHEF